jgi:tetratricopeptide (TPR) repeat protein
MSQYQYKPEDENQAIVETPYGGRGLVVRTRRDTGIREIRLLEWEMAGVAQLKPTLYTTQSYPSVAPLLGDDVLTAFGRGTVVELRPQVLVVDLTNWRLANRSRVKCYLQRRDVQVLRKKTLAEMDGYERVTHAQKLKLQANTYFSLKLYDKALLTYAEAVEAVRYVQHDSNSNNQVRADLVAVMITCCNNAGTCCVQLAKWDEAIKFSRNALVLLDALYNKRGLQIHTVLNRDGIHDAQLFGEWRVKSHILTARALTEKQCYPEAMDALKLAHDTIVEYTTANAEDTTAISKSIHNLIVQGKEVKRLHTLCVNKRKLEKKKEKQRAQAMFGGPLATNATADPKNEDEGQSQTPEVQPVDRPTPAIDEAIQDDDVGIPTTRSTQTLKKRVSFKDPVDDDDEPTDNNEGPWYREHFEALVLVAGILGGVAVTALLISKRSSR